MKPFVRLDPARSGDGHCGLGLAIVARLARDSGGRCEVTNAAGGGLNVRIAIPVHKERQAHSASNATASVALPA
jgi:two-component system osmolarity sensor histidine kinase EnvZ